jgi:hypothetical protein
MRYFHPKETPRSFDAQSAPPQGKIDFQVITTGDYSTMQIGQAGELDHGSDDLL